MHRSHVIRIARAILLLLALAGIVVTALPAASGNTWWIRYLDFPRLEFLIAMIVVSLLLALLARTWLGFLAIAGLVAAIAYDAKVLLPFSTLVGPQQLAAAACPEGNRLVLLEANVQMTNRHSHKLLNMVRQVHPDIAWFQETNDWWAKELSALSDSMPHHVTVAKPNYFGVDLYSRLPLIEPKVEHLTGSYNPAIFSGVRLPSGQVLRLYAIHPRPPQQGQSTAERNAQVLATALAAHNDRLPHVVAGDMNSVPWEDVIYRAQRVGRFLDPRVGRGLYITWNADSWILRWPLDQILPGPGFTLMSLKVLPPFGSDHKPYLAELCADPAAAARQPPPALQQGDLAAAEAAVRKGQGAAQKAGYKGRYGPQGPRTNP